MNDVALGLLALACCEFIRQRDVLDLGDLLAMNRALAEADFESVLVGRIMASGYHHATIDALCEQRVIKNRRGNHSDVEHVAAGFCEATDEDVSETRRALAGIAAEARTGRAVGLEESSNRSRQIVNDFIREVRIDDAPYVIFPKNVLVHCSCPSVAVPLEFLRTNAQRSKGNAVHNHLTSSVRLWTCNSHKRLRAHCCVSINAGNDRFGMDMEWHKSWLRVAPFETGFGLGARWFRV